MPFCENRIRPALELARRLARGAAAPLYIVGGLPRDAALGRPCDDLDLASSLPARPLAAKAARLFGGRLVPLDAERGVYRVVLRRGPFRQLDIARLEGAGIAEDLARRDFTINAMALEASEGKTSPRLLDPFGGERDLKARRLRMVSARAFEEDGLRLLRAFRFAAELDFAIEPATRRAIRRLRARVADPAGERARYELMRLFETPRAAATLRAMDECRLLTAVFPELEAQRRCAKVYYGPGGVLDHSLAVVRRLEELFVELPRLYPKIYAALRNHLKERSNAEASYPALLKLTALLHDVAKPATAKRVEGRLRFFGHEELGGEMARGVLERLRLSREHNRTACAIIAHHLRPGNLAANPTVSDKAVYRFFDEIKDPAVGLLLVCWADYASYLSDAKLKGVLRAMEEGKPSPADAGVAKTRRHLEVVALLLDAYFRRKKSVVAPPRLVDGNDVMRALGLNPGPLIGKLLRRVQEAQAAGKVRGRAEALAFLKKARAGRP